MTIDDPNRALLELMVKVSRELATALDLRIVLQRVLYACIQYVGGESGSVVVVDDQGQTVDAAIVHGKQFHDHKTHQLQDTVDRGLAGWVAQYRRPVLIPDTDKDERWLRRPHDQDGAAKSAICVPLIARDRFVGILTLVHPTANTFNEQHLEFVQAIADQASVAVLNARLYAEAQRTARVMSALAKGAETINSSLEMSDVLQRILDHTMQALQAETAALGLIDLQSEELVFEAAAGQHADYFSKVRISPQQGISGEVIQSAQGRILYASKGDPIFEESKALKDVKARAFAIAPIQVHHKVIGVLMAFNPADDSFDADALQVMTGLGNLAGTTIDNSRLFEQLQNAHKHYRELFEDSIDPIFITDWDGKILEANRQATQLSGYTEEQLRQTNIRNLHVVNCADEEISFNKLKNGGSCSYESELETSEGGKLPVEVHARRVELHDSDAVQWILRDIASRKDLDELRNDMTSMIYHDLRSPLGNIVSSLEMISVLMPEDQTLRSMLVIARNSTERIQRLINSLLDINRLEAGQKIADQNSIDPVEIIREAIRDVQPGAKARQHKLSNRALSVLPLIWVDVDMIHRVLINLLENAIKFTPANGKIDIGAQTSADGMFVNFWVRDSGPGIPLAERERIFEKFTRVRGKSKVSGLGVGLAFCRLAVHAHDGEIWVESEEDKGTTFWLSLPVAQRRSSGTIKRQTGRLTFKPDHQE
ncbi:MAG: GAF domain-containing protein [Anaerolineales bacterium]|nr:GAF domain-containing protein [Anaerolineales bacterium]